MQPIPPVSEAPHLGPILEDRARPLRFEPRELAIVLSHYDLGVIEQIRVFARGSPRAPKVRLRGRGGDFLLKRRAPGRDDPGRVAFAHAVQAHLSAAGYPVPAIVATRDGQLCLRLEDRTYEIFQFQPGVRYDGSVPGSYAAGEALAALHQALAACHPPGEPPRSGYHAAAGIDAGLSRIPEAVVAREPGASPAGLRRTCESLRDAYNEAAGRVERGGFASWPAGIIHGDWHPGNLLYDGRGRVSGVLDFDSARREPLAADLANGALQFSMTYAPQGDPARSPDGLDLDRLGALVRGYRRAGGQVGPEALAALPWLMIEALVLESVVPIAATGAFGGISGTSFLHMIEAKVHWIMPRVGELAGFLRVG